MSFGFGLGDFLAVGELAWSLYKDVYLVAQAAPQEVDQLEKQLSTLRNSLDILKEDFTDENSIVQKAGPERLKAAEDILRGVYDTLQDLQIITTKYKKKFDSSRGKLRRGWDKIGFAITDAKEIDGIRNKIAYHNGLMTLLLTAIGNTSLQRLESSNSKIENGINKIMNHVGITSTPMISKRPGMEDEIFNASISANLLRYAEIEKPWASIGLFDWIQAGKWWLIRYQSDFEVYLAENKPLTLDTYLHLIKSAWILTDLIVLHPQRNHLDEAISAEIEMLVKAIAEEFDRLESRKTEIPSLDDIEDNHLRIWEKHDGTATLQPGQRRKEGMRRWIIATDLIIYQKFAKYQDGNSSLSKATTALVLLLVNKKTKGVRLIIHDQSWHCLAEYTDKALMENKATIGLSSESQNTVLFDSHSLVFCSQLDAEVFHGILLVESHLIRPYNDFFERSSIQMHYTFLLLHGLVEGKKELVKHFLGLRNALPQGKLGGAEQSLDDAVLQSSSAILTTSIESIKPVDAKPESNILIRRLLSSEFSDIAQRLADLRKIRLSDGMVESQLCPRQVLKEKRTDMFRLLLDSDPQIIYEYSNESPDDLLSLAVSLELVDEVTLIAAAHERVGGLEAALKRSSKIGGFRTALSWICQHWNRQIFDILFKGYGVLPGFVADKCQKYPLHWAAENGHTEAVQILLSQTATSIKMGRGQDPTPLHFAAQEGHISTVRFLLSIADTECNAMDFNHQTPLILAAEAGHLEVVKALANHHGVDINHQSLYTFPLMGAATKGHEKVVDFLLSLEKIQPSIVNCVGRTALSFAAACGRAGCVRLLIDRTVEEADRDGRRSLSRAAEKGHTEVVRIIAERNPEDATHRDKQGKRPLHYACQAANGAACVQYLLSRSDVDPNSKTNQDATPLQLAVQGGNIDAVRVLLEREEVDINWKASSRPNDRTALMISAIKAREDIAELLLRREDIDVNLKDKNLGATALHYAAEHPDGEGILRRILAHTGANPTIRSDIGRTPFDACLASGAKSEKKDRRIKLLEDAVAAWERPQKMVPQSVAPELLADLKPKLTAVHVEDIQLEEKMGLTGTATTITFTTSPS